MKVSWCCKHAVHLPSETSSSSQLLESLLELLPAQNTADCIRNWGSKANGLSAHTWASTVITGGCSNSCTSATCCFSKFSTSSFEIPIASERLTQWMYWWVGWRSPRQQQQPDRALAGRYLTRSKPMKLSERGRRERHNHAFV